MSELPSSRERSTAIAERIARLSPEKRALLELQLKQAPLSLAQQRLWFLEQLEPGGSTYTVPVAGHVLGVLDVGALERSINEIVRRHEALRTTFRVADGEPLQIIAPALEVPLVITDLADVPALERHTRAQRVAEEEARRPFDLAHGPLVRTTLLRFGQAEHVLILTLHHIVTDGWSMRVFFRELAALYGAFSAGRLSPLPELPIQYAEYSLRQRTWLRGEVMERQLSYWRQQLAALPVLALPTDRSRYAPHTNYGDTRSLQLNRRLTAALKALSRRERVTLFMPLLAGFQMLLARYTGQDDVAVGCPIAGRHHAHTEPMIGLLINTLVFRTDLSGDPTVRELVRRVRGMALEAYEHQDIPFEKLVEELHPPRDLHRTPLFQVMFTVQDSLAEGFALPGLTVNPLSVRSNTAKFDLTVSVADVPRGLHVQCSYNADLFEATTIERMLGHYQVLLEEIATNPERRISDLSLVADAERRELLSMGTGHRSESPTEQSVDEIFEAQAERTPESVALVCEGQVLTYAQLNKRANQLAHYLLKAGVGRGALVGVCLDRSPEMVLAFLAVLKAGCAYVPVDPAYPTARVRLMFDDARVRVVLTRAASDAQLRELDVQLVRVDTDWPSIAREPQHNPNGLAGAPALAYVMYTSGSTGTPKGVAVPHGAIIRRVRNTDYAPLAATDVVAHLSNPAFDAVTFEVWGALLNGARLVIVDQNTVLSPKRFAALLRAHHVTALFVTTALFNLMAREEPGAFASVTQLLFGGEAADPHSVRAVLRDGAPERLLHVYGPTETTTFATCHEVREVPAGAATVPIGRPIAHTRVYVLDERFSLMPVGVPGELYIGGGGVAWGYLNRPELTAEQFIPDRWTPEPGARLYRTGDRVRWRTDGTLEFLGRLDDQVKLRGFRIEPGEIKAALDEHPTVSESAVVLGDEGSGGRRLVGYVVPTGDTPDAHTLRRFLAARLPAHAVPSAFVFLDALPLSPNGKVDRRALPPPPPPDAARRGSGERPRDDFERRLLLIWERTLDLTGLGISDNFFELGGHSLLAVRLFCEIEKAWGRNLPLATLFQAPTVEQLAAVLRQTEWTEPWASLVALQPAGRKPPLFLVHSVGGNVLSYSSLAQHLAPDQPVYGLQAVGLDGSRAPYTRIEDMAAHYLREIRTVQPDGAYRLGGASFGGVVAFEMARQLCAQGGKVALLALFDSHPPKGRTRSRAAKIRSFARRAAYHARNVILLVTREKLSYISARTKTVRRRLRTRIWHLIHKAYQRLERPLPPALRSVKQAAFLAFREYQPGMYLGPVTLFRARERGVGGTSDPTSGWGHWAVVETYEVPGDHLTMMTAPHVEVLVERLRQCLDQADGASSPPSQV